jgi:SAM-dependent methyltransferase
MSGNSQQIEYWNGMVGERWARLQDDIDRMLGAITEGFIGFADAKPGERVLDIGCGCGTTTLTFAQCVRPGGSVAGIDISVPQLSVARARAAAQQAEIPFIEADASTHDFQPVFDLVVSRFGVMFFADPVGAFRNIGSAFRGKGRIAFVCWRGVGDNKWASVPMAAALPLLPPQEPSDPLAPGPFAFADSTRLATILAEAGFDDIHIEAFDGHADMGDTPDDAAARSLNIGPLSRAAAESDVDTRTRISNVVSRALAAYQTPRGVYAPVACWFVRASK